MCGRLRPSAARVPSRVASTVAETPMRKLFLIEWIHCSLANMSRYQRSDQASGLSLSISSLNVK